MRSQFFSIALPIGSVRTNTPVTFFGGTKSSNAICWSCLMDPSIRRRYECTSGCVMAVEIWRPPELRSEAFQNSEPSPWSKQESKAVRSGEPPAALEQYLALAKTIPSGQVLGRLSFLHPQDPETSRETASKPRPKGIFLQDGWCISHR